jgi:hypothetical protein
MAYTKHLCNVPECGLERKSRYIPCHWIRYISLYCEKHSKRNSRRGHPTRPLPVISKIERKEVDKLFDQSIKNKDLNVRRWLGLLKLIEVKSRAIQHRGTWGNWSSDYQLLPWLIGECVRRKGAPWTLKRMILVCTVADSDRERDFMRGNRRFRLAWYATWFLWAGVKNGKHIGMDHKCAIGGWLEVNSLGILSILGPYQHPKALL